MDSRDEEVTVISAIALSALDNKPRKKSKIKFQVEPCLLKMSQLGVLITLIQQMKLKIKNAVKILYLSEKYSRDFPLLARAQ